MSFLRLRFQLLLFLFCLFILSAGAISAQNAANFVSIPPCRLVDTRYAVAGISFGPPFLAGKTSRDFPIPASSCNVPAGAVSYSLNLTLVPHGPVLYVTAWPAGRPQPNASTMNAPSGDIIANAALVPAGANGAVSIYVDGDTDLIVDINGYFVPPSTAVTDALNQQVGQLNQQVTQANQQGGQLAQQIGQQAAVVGQHTTQIGQLTQQITQLGQQTSLQTGLPGTVSVANNTIEIGNAGQSGDNGLIRLGTPGVHQKTYIAGINNVQIDMGEMVLVDENGQLGTILSSARYKEDVQDIGAASDALLRLRPVQFRYKRAAADGSKPLQFGLIAEEVAQVFPQLIVYNRQGEIETVQYHQLPALLLNEYQKQRRQIDRQQQELEDQRAKLQAQQEETRRLRTRLAALEAQAGGSDKN